MFAPMARKITSIEYALLINDKLLNKKRRTDHDWFNQYTGGVSNRGVAASLSTSCTAYGLSGSQPFWPDKEREKTIIRTFLICPIRNVSSGKRKMRGTVCLQVVSTSCQLLGCWAARVSSQFMSSFDYNEEMANAARWSVRRLRTCNLPVLFH